MQPHSPSFHSWADGVAIGRGAGDDFNAHDQSAPPGRLSGATDFPSYAANAGAYIRAGISAVLPTSGA